MEICIEAAERNGNLHLLPKGEFSSDTALKLTAMMKEKYNGKGNIFVNTAEVTEVWPLSKQTFCKMLVLHNLPKDKIFLKGKKGKELCHDEGKVIEFKPKKHGGCGRCSNCKCGTKKKPH